MKKTSVRLGLMLVLVACVGFFGFAPGIADKRMNKVVRPAKVRAPSEQTLALHETLFVADLHADSLLWGRNLLQRHDHGHVDLPRLIEGNVALQVFDAVTKSPKSFNIDRNDDTTDNIRLLAVAQRWPLAALTSLTARALHQADALHGFVAKSEGKLRFIGSRADLAALREARAAGERVTGAMLGIEGAHALDGDLDNVGVLYDAGYRLIGYAHFFDNVFSGSAHGVKKGGLSEQGRALLSALEAKRITVDLAHASHATIDDVLKTATRPVVVSHTGVKGTCDNNRNLSDAQLLALKRNGGLIGIGFWPTAVCGDDHAAIVRALRHAVTVMGEDHVSLGSDYDGTVSAPFDVSQLAELTEALRASGMSDAVIRKLMGENTAAFFAANLP